jgi:hypothetical protein
MHILVILCSKILRVEFFYLAGLWTIAAAQRPPVPTGVVVVSAQLGYGQVAVEHVRNGALPQWQAKQRFHTKSKHSHLAAAFALESPLARPTRSPGDLYYDFGPNCLVRQNAD